MALSIRTGLVSVSVGILAAALVSATVGMTGMARINDGAVAIKDVQMARYGAADEISKAIADVRIAGAAHLMADTAREQDKTAAALKVALAGFDTWARPAGGDQRRHPPTASRRWPTFAPPSTPM